MAYLFKCKRCDALMSFYIKWIHLKWYCWKVTWSSLSHFNLQVLNVFDKVFVILNCDRLNLVCFCNADFWQSWQAI